MRFQNVGLFVLFVVVNIRPICLAPVELHAEINERKKLAIAGWGATGYG